MDADMLTFQAGSFLTSYVSLYINNSQASDSSFIIPMIVNGTFSVELSLKALLVRLGINYGREHNLFYLYYLLPTDYAWEIFTRSIAGTPTSRDLRRWMDNLILISNAFEEWRYGFEAKHSLVLNSDFLSLLVQAAYGTLTDHFGEINYDKVEPIKSDEYMDQEFSSEVVEQRQAAIEKIAKVFQKRGLLTDKPTRDS